jgi:hypothetical protein
MHFAKAIRKLPISITHGSGDARAMVEAMREAVAA